MMWTVVTWAAILSCTVVTASGFFLGEPAGLTPLLKRSSMDLAMMQVYNICDGDKDGVFIKRELQCVHKVLLILLTGR